MITRYKNDTSWHFGHVFAAGCVILAGLMLRRHGYSIGLPFIIVKYGGSLLWGAMVYLLLAAGLPRRHWVAAVSMACAAAITVELIRLIHFPWLDEFRATMAGALLLGRVFSVWNIACYLAGIILAAVISRRLFCRLDERVSI